MDISTYLSIEPYITTGMTSFQMDKFVIEDQITPYRKMKQAVTETRARLENITSIGFDLEELEIKVLKTISDQENATNQHEKQLLSVQIRRYQFEQNRKMSILNQQRDEVEFFYNALISIVNKDFGGKTELLKLLENPEFQSEQEKQFWTQKLSRSVASDLINYGTISKGVYEAVVNLSNNQQKAIIADGTHSAQLTRDILAINRDQALVELNR
jgi:hypothetical protein